MMWIVRWDDGTTELCSASSFDELMDALDEVSDPADAIVRQYRGPIRIPFGRPELVDGMVQLHVDGYSGEDGNTMREKVLKAAFPRLGKALDKGEPSAAGKARGNRNAGESAMTVEGA